MVPEKPDITQLLRRGKEGDQEALNEVMPLVYRELRKLAGIHLRNQTPGHTLQPTALVHEAYVRLVDRAQPDWQDRSHFFCVAARMMRQILVDHARAKCADKRGGQQPRVELEDSIAYTDQKAEQLVALDEALERLGALDERKARVLELRYFGGLSTEETAQAMNISVATVGREKRFAEAWLRTELASG